MFAYWPTLVLTLLYLLFVWYGPKLMKNRQPFEFRYTLFVYNLALVALNYHICSEVSFHIYEFESSIFWLENCYITRF
jgi:elongation of very long chain fatty acids protein 4